jgi:hypothetical protein
MKAHESISTDGSARRSSSTRYVLALLLAAATLAGCVRRYDIMLTNGGELTNVRKPTRDETNGYYTYLNSKGQTNIISIGRVIEIHPHQRVDFNAPDTH